ncbi:probable mitochondrial glutathione transporter SLC25A40 [Bacillus rossius redtenbacheri]|uniref:probable mitochondrial glutathione transporter SLC25A40 n=1 Tax=Bacillus rossius redtenbacheri TaxID=93214 RepID=UPI002FDCCF3B
MAEGSSCSADDPKFRITTTQQMAASCTGALITSLMVTPLDVVKVRLQSHQKTSLSNKCFLYCNGLMDHLCPCENAVAFNCKHENGTVSINLRSPPPATSSLEMLTRIVRTEGVLSLWSGLSPTLVLSVPAMMVYFVTYENLRLAMRDARGGGELPFWAPALAGSLSRTWAATLVSPLELVRTKMQSKKMSYLEIGNALKALHKHHGLLGFFKGLSSTLMRDVPFSAIYWASYETIKKYNPAEQPSFQYSFMAGATAGSIAAVCTHPFDLVKTHQQIEFGEKEIFSDPPKKSSSLSSVMKRIFHQRGIKGLYAGLGPRLVRVSPACAIMIASFEYGKNFFYRFSSGACSWY